MSRLRRETEDCEGWTRWIRTRQNQYRILCCDCGLAHDLEFKVSGQGNILFRAKRNNRSTATFRKANANTLERT